MIPSNKFAKKYGKKSLIVCENFFLLYICKQKEYFWCISFICNVCFVMFVRIKTLPCVAISEGESYGPGVSGVRQDTRIFYT